MYHNLIHQRAGLVEVLGRQGDAGQSAQRCAAKIEIAQPLGDRQGRAGGSFVAIDICQRGERVPLGEGAFLGEF